ncbi:MULTISPECIES: DUF1269 domain-containing protein [Streptomyces]|uniref:DUF1269 domain-containing protein n=1 Tax=Streptomyces TaxID=1883 RepID=UPI00099CFD6D|nr:MULTISPECIES: DUF1269 domain-containing protein [Streptomyces]
MRERFHARHLGDATGPLHAGAPTITPTGSRPAGALGGRMADAGIDDDFIDSVKSKVTRGTSALFLSTDAVIDRVRTAFPTGHAELIQSNLDTTQEAKLREAFAACPRPLPSRAAVLAFPPPPPAVTR